MTFLREIDQPDLCECVLVALFGLKEFGGARGDTKRKKILDVQVIETWTSGKHHSAKHARYHCAKRPYIAGKTFNILTISSALTRQ